MGYIHLQGGVSLELNCLWTGLDSLLYRDGEMNLEAKGAPG